LSKQKERELQRCVDRINESFEKYNRAQHRRQKEKHEKIGALEKER